MIATNVRRLGLYLLLSFAIVSGGLAWWQVVDAQQLATRQDNPLVIAARRSALRGSIFDANGALLASSAVTDGISRRTYVDQALAQVIGYASLRFGTTGVERAWDDVLTGRTDPNPFRNIVNDILARQPQPSDLTLTIDKRLQDFAAAKLGANPGAIVALDPRTGAILAMVSTPGFDASGFSGDPTTAQAAWDAVAGAANNPFLDRTRQGHYTPGSIMKIVTTSAALDSGAITPQTTFADQPRQETEGFLLDGFTIHEHGLGSVRPALWSLSSALQVSSNISLSRLRAALRLLPPAEHRRGRSDAAGRCVVCLRPLARWLCPLRRPRRARQRGLRPGGGGSHPDAGGARGGHHRQRGHRAPALRRARPARPCRHAGQRAERRRAADLRQRGRASGRLAVGGGRGAGGDDRRRPGL
ncbi:MAG: hypothetical protein E6J47_03755, partial [Chloroflexi bacterium]